MALFVRTGNGGSDPAFMINDLGFQVPTGAGFTELTLQFTAVELRDSADLTAAISGGSLECSTDGATKNVEAGAYDQDLALVIELNLREISEEPLNEELVDGSVVSSGLHTHDVVELDGWPTGLEDHLDGNASKHDASEIDVEGTYTNIAGTPTDLETTISGINEKLGTLVGQDTFSTITGDSGSATADAANDSLAIVGTGGITTAVTDDPEVVTINGSGLLPLDGSRAMTSGLNMGGFNIGNVGTVDGVDVSALDSTVSGHISDGSIHFTESSIDHENIQNIGTNTHDEIDSHIADTSIHYPQSGIDHGVLQGLGDDDHPQYTEWSQDETVSGVWKFNPANTEPNEILTPRTAVPNAHLVEGATANVNGIIYVYDSTRSKFLSLQHMELITARNSTSARNVYLRIGEGIPSNETGYRMLRDGTITGLSVATAQAETWTLEVYRSGSVIASLSITAAKGKQDATINVDFSAGDELAFFVNSADGTDRPVAIMEYAWRV
jgi:hypothetical protein